MERIEQWFQSAARRQERVVTLYPSLLRNRFGAYFAYRLRYLLSLRVFTFTVHVAEFLILLAYAPKLALVIVVLLRAGGPLVRGAWWGALEVLRERVRDMSGIAARNDREQEIAHWLLLSGFVAVLVLIVVAAWLMWHASDASSDTNTLIHLYIALIGIELALRIPILALHAGIYATRRIYRSLFSILLPTIVQAALIAVLFSSLKEGALIIAIIASNACSLVLSFIYINRMYRIVGIRPNLRQATTGFVSFLRGLPGVYLMWSTTAGLLIRIDSLLILVLVGLETIGGDRIDLTAGHPEWNTPDLGILLYLILPAIRGSYGWSILFYFDFVRLRRVSALRHLLRIFLTKLVFAATLVGLFFWGLAVIVFLVGFRDIPFTFLIAMLPLFLVRAWLAVYQVRAFADGRFMVVCLSVAILIAGTVVAGVGGFADIGSLFGIKLCMLAALSFLVLAQVLYDRARLQAASFLSLADWCRSLSEESGEIDAGTIEVAATANEKQRSATRAVLEEQLAGRGHCAWRDENILIYYQRAENAGGAPFDPLDVLEAAGGLVVRAERACTQIKGGRGALVSLQDQGQLPPLPAKSSDVSELIEAFHAAFPSGLAVDMMSYTRPQEMASLEGEAVNSAIPHALQALNCGATYIWCGSHRLCPVFLYQELRLLLFIPARHDAAALTGWRNTFLDWSLSQCAPSTLR